MLGNFVKDFRDAMVSADSLRPSVQGRKQIYHPGIGPHSELHAVALTVDQMKLSQPHQYASRNASALSKVDPVPIRLHRSKQP